MITKPLLAATLKPDQLHLLKYPVLVSPKLDGIRALMVDGKLVSRNFKPIPNKFIRDTLQSNISSGFDGELMLRDPKATFQDITSAVMSHEGEPDFVYRIFDYVSNGLEQSFKHRYNLIERWRGCDQIVKPVAHDLIETQGHLEEYEYACLEMGYEGVMIRDPRGRYKCGRSTLKEGILIKLKRFQDSEAQIIGFEELETNNNEKTKNELGYAKRSTKKEGKVKAGTLGNFIVRDIHTGVEFKIGSGLDTVQRKNIWDMQPHFIAKIIRYKFFPVGVKEKPRHPVFQGFRHEDDL